VWLYDPAHAKKVAKDLHDAFKKLHEWLADKLTDSSLENTQCRDSAPMASNFQDDACDFMLPSNWTVGRYSPFSGHLSWYMWSFDFPPLENDQFKPWQELDTFPVTQNRRVRINVSTQKSDSDSWRDCDYCCMDDEGVSAQCDSLYTLSEVTGLSFAVHAVLIRQAETANVLLGACQKIEKNNKNNFNSIDFWFMSSCATKSVGCAMLLIMLKYPLAQIRLSMRQTIDEAKSLEMIPMESPS